MWRVIGPEFVQGNDFADPAAERAEDPGRTSKDRDEQLLRVKGGQSARPVGGRDALEDLVGRALAVGNKSGILQKLILVK